MKKDKSHLFVCKSENPSLGIKQGLVDQIHAPVIWSKILKCEKEIDFESLTEKQVMDFISKRTGKTFERIKNIK